MAMLCLCLLFSSCGKMSVTDPSVSSPSSIEGLYEISCRGFDFTARVRAEYGELEMTLVAPANIAGYKISCSDNEYIFDMFGVTSVRRVEDSPSSSLPSMLYPVIRSLISGSGKHRMNGSTHEYETGLATAVLDDSGILSFSDSSGAVKAVRVET